MTWMAEGCFTQNFRSRWPVSWSFFKSPVFLTIQSTRTENQLERWLPRRLFLTSWGLSQQNNRRFNTISILSWNKRLRGFWSHSCSGTESDVAGMTLFEALFEAHSISLSQKKNFGFSTKSTEKSSFWAPTFAIFSHFWPFLGVWE